MAQQQQQSVAETLDGSSSDRSPGSQSPTTDGSTDPSPSLSRNVSFSRLNAKAPEFVPLVKSPSGSGGVLQTAPPPSPQQKRVSPIHVYAGPPAFVPIHHHQGQYHHHHGYNQHHHQQQPHQYYVAKGEGNGGGGGGVYREREKDKEREQEVAVAVQHTPNESQDQAAHTSKNNGVSDDIIHKCVNQVEYYFSDINLATTDHLLRFIHKDHEGYVPMSIVASFKKIKSFTENHTQLASILRHSTKLVVSEDGKKVKRLHPLTETDLEELQARIVVAENLPDDHCHQSLMKLFSSVGSVKTIRTCQPQPNNSVSSSASRQAKADGMHISNKLHAFVEYETVELAEKAVAELNDERNWRRGLRVKPFPRHMPKHSRGKKGHEGEGHNEEDNAEHQSNDKPLENSAQQPDGQSHEHVAEDHANDREGPKKARGRGRGKGRGRGQPHHHNNNHHNNRHIGSPSSNDLPIVTKQPPGPRMPDGTRGFAIGRGKPIAVAIAQ